MMTTPILEELYTTQKHFDDEAHQNLQEYVRQAHQHVCDLAKEYGFTLNYRTRSGGNISLLSEATYV